MADQAVMKSQRQTTSSAREENEESVRCEIQSLGYPHTFHRVHSVCFIGDPISVTKMHLPNKKHFAGAVDDPLYDPDKPYQHLTKVKLRLDHYRELDHALLQDIIFIVNVPILCHTGDSISVQIGSKVISVECPRLARRQNRFILCFVK